MLWINVCDFGNSVTISHKHKYVNGFTYNILWQIKQLQQSFNVAN